MRGLVSTGMSVVAATMMVATPGLAQTPSIGIRTGSHPTYGRVVFDLPPGASYALAQDGERVVITFKGSADLGEAGAAPRNVRSIVAKGGVAELSVASGVRIRPVRLGDRLVIDVLDSASEVSATPPVKADAPAPRAKSAPPPEPVSAAPSVPPAPAPRARSVAVEIPTPAATPRAGSPDSRQRAIDSERLPAPPLPSPVPPRPAQAVEVAALVPAPPVPTAVPATPPTMASTAAPQQGGRAAILPFAADTGAAAFRRGPEGLVVFDERRPIDLSALRNDPALGSAAITMLTGATLLRVPLGPREEISLARVPAGWRIAVTQGPAAVGKPIRPESDSGRLRIAVQAPGNVVSVPDPLTGGNLLVGVVKADGQMTPVYRMTPEFQILPTWQGIAIIPASDALTMRAGAADFVLATGSQRPLAISVPDSQTLVQADAYALSRRYDFPALPTEALLRRLQTAIAGAAVAAPQSRAVRRQHVAQAMIALGMGVEAQSVLALATTDDGRASDDPDVIGLSAIAALMAGRISESDGILDPRLTGTDEVAFWRAVKTAQREDGATVAAPTLAATLNLLFAYPAAIRERISPLVAETLVRGGEAAAARRLFAKQPDDTDLDYARALDAEGSDPAAALALHDKVAQSANRRARARAAMRAIDLRVASGELSSAKGADALDKLLYAWRGDGLELAARQRLAELRAAAGSHREALALLRETAEIFPDQAAQVRSQLTDIFSRAVGAEGSTAPSALDLVALAEENADVLPAGSTGQALASKLADRLIALDLPRRAVPVLEKLLTATPPGDARSELGMRLAGLLMDQGDPKGALAALADTAYAGPVPPALLEQRTLAYARAVAASGHLAPGLDALAQLGTERALELRASLLEQSKDWREAVRALRTWTDRVVPVTGPLDDDQVRALLRLASAAAQAQDDLLLAELRNRDLPRLPQGRMAETFRLLTADPIRAVSDLPRAAQEAKLARAIPGGAAAPPAR